MKRTMAFAMALAVAAAAANPSATISVAPYEDVSAKTAEFGELLGNPAIPALLMAMLQRTVVSTYGKFRTNSPFYMVSYAGASGRNEDAVVFPSTDRIARMALANPGSERQGEDVLHLMPSQRNANERYAVFAADGRYVSFAATEKLARQAIADCPLAKDGGNGPAPLVSAALSEAGVKSVCRSGRKAGVTNLVDAVECFSSLDISFDLAGRGLVLSYSGAVRDKTRARETAARLENELKTMLSGIKGENGATVGISAKPSQDGSRISGEAVVSKEILKGMGKDFNSFVAAQMSGALTGGGKGKGKGEKGAKTKERAK